SRVGQRVGDECSGNTRANDDDVTAPVARQRWWYLPDSIAKEPERVGRSQVQELIAASRRVFAEPSIARCVRRALWRRHLAATRRIDRRLLGSPDKDGRPSPRVRS